MQTIRSRERVFQWPVLQSVLKRGSADASVSGPLGLRHSLSVELNHHVGSLVSRLDSPRRPSAVRSVVMSVDVDSIQRESLWAWSHVLNEARELSHPLRVDRDAAPTVIGELFGPWIQAAVLHGLPRFVLTHTAAACASVLHIAFAHAINGEASATLGLHGPKVCGANGPYHAAFTLAHGPFASLPRLLRLACVGWSENSPATEDRADFWLHEPNYTALRGA
jgi:hypothetical protein